MDLFSSQYSTAILTILEDFSYEFKKALDGKKKQCDVIKNTIDWNTSFRSLWILCADC